MFDSTKMTPNLILASTSRYRAEMLTKCGLSFSQKSPEYIEQILPEEQPSKAALRLAEGKAQAVANSLGYRVNLRVASQPKSATIIVGSDQVACLNKTVLTKPGSATRAIEQLSACSGQWVNFHTGLFVLYKGGGGTETRETGYVEEFSVKFRQLTASEIRRYVALDQPLDCAGSFKAEGLGLTLFDDMRGRDIHTLYGLPLLQLLEVLRDYGINPISSL